jgi:hypothetical protein
MSIQLTHGRRPGAYWERHLGNCLKEGALAIRLVSADNNLGDTNLRINVLATKPINGIE